MTDSSLIFIISQPRSGSSLLQQLLLNNIEIVSSPEPWQMLSLIYTYKKNNIASSYNPFYAVENFTRYLDEREDGFEDYKNRVKKLALDLYKDRLGEHQYFLDKTPRYYHIIKELYEFFPNAKFIFLVRNPLAVFASILDYNFKGDYKKFLKSEDRIDDLFLAPKLVEEGIKIIKDSITISYEDLITNTDNTLKKINSFLSLETPLQADYEVKGSFSNSKHVDTKSLDKHSKPVSDYLDSWKKTINTIQKKQLALEYLAKLQQVDSSRYNIREIEKMLKVHSTDKTNLFSIPLDLLINREEKLSIFQLIKKRILIKLNKKGL
ncbi:MAG: sulfotransferase [Winogradskyella sp.]|uniref:sulfotransferase family protein n=1 Tax=Winogradskyella sp. TaxID=1883156 RepID=UPI0025CD3116|nr:sulfotransferase [Winogradskyella sp.]NRB59423.1 sulfotransferase [Winogradskyella sp.]